MPIILISLGRGAGHRASAASAVRRELFGKAGIRRDQYLQNQAGAEYAVAAIS